VLTKDKVTHCYAEQSYSKGQQQQTCRQDVHV